MELILIVKAIIMGLVEGATEFLPISSTGHLIVAGEAIDFLSKEKRDVFEIVIQLGAILAVVWKYRAKFMHVTLNLAEKKSQQLVLNLLVAFLPLALIGLAFHKQIKALLFNPQSVAIALIVGGFVMIWLENHLPKVHTEQADDLSLKQAIKVGFAQSLALIPGVSRAGATIMGGMMFGLSRTAATEFSFFLAVPVMVAATAYDMTKNWALFDAGDVPVMAAGFITAFVSALVAINVLVRYVSNHNFKPFAYYRIVFGIAVLAYFAN